MTSVTRPICRQGNRGTSGLVRLSRATSTRRRGSTESVAKRLEMWELLAKCSIRLTAVQLLSISDSYASTRPVVQNSWALFITPLLGFCTFLNPWSHTGPPMAPKPQRQKRRDSVQSPLDSAIQDVALARDICSISPAQAAFDSVSAFLAAIRVCLLLFREDELPVYTCSGFNPGHRTGLRRHRHILR